MATAGTGTTLHADTVRPVQLALVTLDWAQDRLQAPTTRGKLPAINSNFDAGLGFCRCFNVCFLDRAVTINKELLCEIH